MPETSAVTPEQAHRDPGGGTAGSRTRRRHHGLWWLLAAAALPWLAVAVVLATAAGR